MIGGDPGAFRADATQVRGWVDGLESDAASLRRGEGVHWVGLAGDSFRRRISERAQEALATCGRCETYAAALDDLAATLEARQQQLAALLAEAGATADELRDAVVNGAGDALDVAQGMASAARDLAEDAAGGVKDAATDAWDAVTSR